MISDQSKYELRKIELDAREAAAKGGYPLTQALANLCGVRLTGRGPVLGVDIKSEVGQIATVTVKQAAVDFEGNLALDPGYNQKHTWSFGAFEDRPEFDR